MAKKRTKSSPTRDPVALTDEDAKDAALRKLIEELDAGLTPTAEHARSIWKTSYIPARYTPATPEMIAAAEARLQVTIPESMQRNLKIQNGGSLPDCDCFPFEAVAPWTNATVDGILGLEEWELASDDHWFDSVRDVEGLHLLVRIAAHSESQFCLDYRRCGKTGIPAVTYVDVCMTPTQVTIVTESIDEFVSAMVAARPDDA